MPLQLLKLEPEHEMAVIEIGMSHAGEITALAKLAQPDCGVVTMVAPVHLEYFESIAAIAHAKQELIESLPPSGIAVLNADDPYVSQFGRDFPGKVMLLWTAQARRCNGSRTSKRSAPWVRPSTSSSKARPLAPPCPCWASTTSTTHSPAWPWACSTGCPCEPAAESLASSLRETSAARCCISAEQPSSTIATIRIRRRWKAWFAHWPNPAQRRIVVAGEMLELGRARSHAPRQRSAHGTLRHGPSTGGAGAGEVHCRRRGDG